MKYLADLLTLSRFILALVIFYCCFTNSGSAEAVFLMFFAAVLTDAFDGTCAKKWPFPKNKTPKYRKYAALYDMVSDVLLAAAQVLFVTLRINWIVGLIAIIYYVVICGSSNSSFMANSSAIQIIAPLILSPKRTFRLPKKSSWPAATATPYVSAS